MERHVNLPRMQIVRWICTILAACLVASALLIVNAEASGRAAVVDSIVGDVYVQKSGGSRELQAYVGMALGEGDLIRTASASSVVLTVADRDDKVTVDANAEVYISELREDGGKKSRLKTWAGNVYVKARSLFGTNDEVEVETPNTTMGVRGTHFMVGVDPETGESWVSVFSGIVQGKRNSDSAESDLYPTQMMFHLGDDDSGDGPPIVMVDTQELIDRLGEEIFRQLILDRPDIRTENEEEFERIVEEMKSKGYLLEDPSGEVSEDEQERLSNNLDRVVDVIIRNAIENGRLDENEVQEIINRVQSQTGITQPPLGEDFALDTLMGERIEEEEERLRQLREQQERQKEEERRQREQQQQTNSDLMAQLEEQRNIQQQENESVMEEERQQALDRYLEQLDEAERERFEEAQRKREEERRNAIEEKTAREERLQQAAGQTDEETEESDASGDSGSSGGSGGSSGGGNSGGSDDQEEPEEPEEPVGAAVELVSSETLVTPEGMEVSIRLYNVSDISGVQLHLMYEPYIRADSASGIALDVLQQIDDEPIVFHREVLGIDPNDEQHKKEWIYSLIVDDEFEDSVTIGEDGATIVNIRFIPEYMYPFLINDELPPGIVLEGQIQLVELIVIDAEGNSVIEGIDHEKSIDYRIDSNHLSGVLTGI